MPKPVIWSPHSEQDFDQILDYLQKKWDFQVIEKFIEITELLIDQISLYPKRFPVINKKLNVRKCVLTKHNTLFYREMKNHIDILRIYDSRQDPKKLEFD